MSFWSTNVTDGRTTCDRKTALCTTRGVQKVRSLIQLTTEYEHDILSLFNIVPFNRNALGPATLQSLYSVVEEFLILVLQPVTRSAGNIIDVSKFPSFYEFLHFWKQIEVTGDQVWRIRWAAEQFKTCISNGSLCLWWRMSRCIVLMKQHTASQLSSSLLFQCRSTFSDQFSVVCSCNSSVMFQIVKQYSSFRIPEYGGHDFVCWCETLGGGEVTYFQAILCALLSGSKWWSQVLSTVTNLEIKLSGFSLNRVRRLADVSARSAFRTTVNMRVTTHQSCRQNDRIKSP